MNIFASICDVNFITPTFGDHLLIVVDLTDNAPKTLNVIQKRNLSNYSTMSINEQVKKNVCESNIVWNNLSVSHHWNTLEFLIVHAIDQIAALRDFSTDHESKKKKLSYLPTLNKKIISARDF